MARKQIKIVDGLAENLEDAIETIKSCEKNVVKCWQEMALAVKAIHTKKLWMDKHESFDDCMRAEVGWKKSWAYEMLKAAEVLEDAPITDASMARFLHPSTATSDSSHGRVPSRRLRRQSRHATT